MNKLLTIAAVLVAVMWAQAGYGQARATQSLHYKAVKLVEVDTQGKVLQSQPAQGSLALFNSGTYVLHFGQQERGSYRFVPAGPKQARAMVYFQSANQRRFIAYPSRNSLMVWMQKTPRGTNVYLSMASSAAPPSTQGQSSGSRSGGGPAIAPGIRDGRFTAMVMYGDTSAPNYLLYDRNTGDITANEKGIVFRPNGTFALRTEIGNSVVKGSGGYRIMSNRVVLTFQDQSSMTLTFDQGGKKLNWYGQGGELISEYFFLGVGK